MANVKFDYKNVATLQQYLDPHGRIKPRHKTKLTPQQQNQLTTAVKRARHLALLP
jgi:small subunit ribosomal protein S18